MDMRYKEIKMVNLIIYHCINLIMVARKLNLIQKSFLRTVKVAIFSRRVWLTVSCPVPG